MIIVYNDNGKAKTISPNPKIDIKDCLNAVPDGMDYKIVELTDIPQDKEFKHAMNYDFTFDIEAAKEIHKNKLRAEREILFAALDKQRIIAERRKESTEAIDTEAERLCDVPSLVDTCKTLDEIRAVKL